MIALNLDKNVSERIAALRYPLIYFIVVIHVPWLAGFAAEPGIKSFIGEFFNNGLARVSVPTLTCISGYLIFHMKLDQAFATLIRKRSKALLLPMIVWNLPLVLFLYVIQAWDLTPYQFNHSGQMYPFDAMQWINGVFAINQFPIVGPMHFLRDLYVVSFLAPLMGWMIRRAPLLGFLVVLAIFYPGLDGPFIRTDSIPISFYIGAVAAVQNWDLKKWDSHALPIFFTLLAVCSTVVILQLNQPMWLRVIAPFLIWPLSSVLVHSRPGAWFAAHGQAAIFLFMFHGLVLIFLRRAFPHYHEGRFDLLLWLLVPLIIALVSHWLYLLLARYSPAFLSLLLGGRRPPRT